MEMIGISGGDFLEILKKMAEAAGQKKDWSNEKPLTEMTAEEEARFSMLESQAAALSKEMDAKIKELKNEYERATSKIASDRNRLWADLMDKYQLHGKDLHKDGNKLYEVKPS